MLYFSPLKRIDLLVIRSEAKSYTMADIAVEQFNDDIEVDEMVSTEIEQAEVKMFNKWSLDDVKVDDLSLQVCYLNNSHFWLLLNRYTLNFNSWK